MIDPLERWRALGLPDKPDYAGLLTYAGIPYTQDPTELRDVDVAIVGAPFDDLVSDRPGARFAPRAIRSASCPPGPHLEAKVDALAELRVVDFGDAPVVPAAPEASRRAIEETVRQVVDAGALPVVLGGDHSIAEPDIRACAGGHGPLGLVHFDTHTDTGTEVFGVEPSHGTPMWALVEAGHVDPRRYVQIGLRGYWPGPAELAWQADRGITSFFMHDVHELGVDEVVRRAGLRLRGRGRPGPGLRAGNGHARAGWDDERRAAPGVPGGGAGGRARGRRGRRGDPHGRGLCGRDRARRRPHRAGNPDRHRGAPRLVRVASHEVLG